MEMAARARQALQALQKKVILEPDDLEHEVQIKKVLRSLEEKRQMAIQAASLKAELEEVRRKKAPGAANILGSGGIG